MSKFQRVLIIDDKKDSVEGVQRYAKEKPFQITLDHATNLEDGISLFYEGGGEKGYSGVILDIICLKDREQTIPDRDFLPIALMKVSKIAPNLPLAILTGETDRIEEHKSTYKAAAPVYRKGSDEVKDMLHYLKSEGNKLEVNRVKDSYPEVFDIFNKEYLGSDVEQQLVDCLKNMKSRDYPTILNNLACLRRIQEEIIIKLNKPKLSLIPDQFMTTSTTTRVDVKNAIGYLANNKNFILQGSIIQKFSDNTYDVISANGSHTPYAGPDADVSYKPTRHTVQSCVHAMLDILLWFKSVMDES